MGFLQALVSLAHFQSVSSATFLNTLMEKKKTNLNFLKDIGLLDLCFLKFDLKNQFGPVWTFPIKINE